MPIAIYGIAIDARNDHPFSWSFCTKKLMKGMVIIMKVIELCGLPGCGKSTIVAEIKKNYQKQGILTAQSLYRNRWKIMNNKHAQFIVGLFCLNHLNVNILIILYTLSFRVNRERFWHLLGFIAFNTRLYKKYREDSHDDYLFLDQGVAVSLTSISHESMIKENFVFMHLVKALKKKYNNIIYINCNIDKQQLIRQIRMRNKVGHRFDSISSTNELGDLLDVRKYNLELVQKYLQKDSEVLTLNMRVEKKFIVEEIMNFIV